MAWRATGMNEAAELGGWDDWIGGRKVGSH